MKKLFIHSVSAFLFLLVPNKARSQWELQTTLDGNPPLHEVKAISKDLAWVCSSNGFVYRTTNAGQTWRRTTLVTSTDRIFILDAIDSLTAFVGGAGPNFAGNANLYRTTDGGQSWEVVYTATGSRSFWNMIHFFDAQNGIAQSDPPSRPGAFLIVKTTDGGTTWTPISNPPTANSGEAGLTYSHQFYDGLNGWFGTSDGGRVFRTTDGGETWTGFASGGSGSLWSVNFVSPTTGVRTSDSSPFLTRTTDGGQTWSPVTNLPVSTVTLMFAGAVASTPGSHQIWVSGEATVSSTPFMITSTDGGQSWQQQTLPPLSGNSIQTMSAVTFGDGVDSVRVWAVTLDHSNFESGGQILTYAGVLGELTTDVDERPTAGISDYRLEQNYPNPFNPSTQIFYTLPQASHVTLSIYNLQGQLVQTLVSGEMPAGRHSVAWEAKDERGHNMPSGIYLYKLQAGEFVQVNRMLFIK